MQTLISPENHWALLAVLFACTALSIWLEQKYRWAAKIGGAILTLVLAVALVNLNVIPASAAVFDDFTWGYAVPLAIPLLLLFCLIVVLVNMLFCFVGGKLLRFDLEDIILASNANIGGPTTAAGMAISQGWTKLIGPCMLVGTFGYVIGTWLGILVGSLLGA